MWRPKSAKKKKTIFTFLFWRHSTVRRFIHTRRRCAQQTATTSSGKFSRRKKINTNETIAWRKLWFSELRRQIDFFLCCWRDWVVLMETFLFNELDWSEFKLKNFEFAFKEDFKLLSWIVVTRLRRKENTREFIGFRSRASKCLCSSNVSCYVFKHNMKKLTLLFTSRPHRRKKIALTYELQALNSQLAVLSVHLQFAQSLWGSRAM